MNKAEFERLFRENFAPLTNIAHSFVRDRDTACDIVQHVFIKLWNNIEQVKISSSEKSYLHRAVINTSLNYIEKNKRLTLRDQFLDIENKITWEPYDSGKDELDKKLNQQLFDAIDELPEKCKAVFILSRVEGMKNAEIADHLDISLKTVEKHMGKALKYLRVRLKHLINISVTIIGYFFIFSGRVL